MNELDQFVKHTLRVKHYARYTDDFIIVSRDQAHLESVLPRIETFLREQLYLSLHPTKVSIRKYRQGVDFLGYVILPHCILPRKKTVKRMFRKIRQKILLQKLGSLNELNTEASFYSYLGVLSHANAYKLEEILINEYWLRKER